MITREVARGEWGKFCDRLSESNRDALVTIEFVDSDGRTSVVAADLPLRAVRLDEQSDPCNDLLVIEVGWPGERPVRHVIVEPIHLLLKDGKDDRYNRLHILAENGTSVVTLHPGVTQELARELAVP